MKTFTTAVLAATLGMILMGCSQPSNSNFVPQNPAKPINENLASAVTYCENESTCSPSVGYVLAMIEEDGLEGIGQCTGFLIAPNIVATNSHCIPGHLKYPGASCADTMGIKFPRAQGAKEEIHVCDKILFASDITLDKSSEDFLKKSDYAFFSLRDSSSRPLLKLSRAGIADGDQLKIYSVDPMSDSSPEGRLVTRSCQSVKGSRFIAADLLPQSLVAATFGPECDVHQGNSGSPALAADGSVVGLLHGGFIKDTFNQRKRKLADLLIEGDLERPAYITNLACVPVRADVPQLGNPGTECSAESLQKKTAAQEQANVIDFMKPLEADLDRAYKNWLQNTASGMFKYRGYISFNDKDVNADQGLRITFLPMPECLKPENSWQESGMAISGRLGNTITTHYDVPAFKGVMKFDRYLRVRMQLESAKGFTMEHEFDLKKVIDKDQDVGKTSLVRGFLRKTTQVMKLHTCSAEELAAEPVLEAAPKAP
jgi:hypothetical protein